MKSNNPHTHIRQLTDTIAEHLTSDDNHTRITVIECGDKVLCDFCGEEYNAQNKTTGGFLFDSNAVCPACAPDSLKRIIGYHEKDHIKSYCPTGMSFHDWVMQLRGGNNTIKVTTK